MRFLVCTLFVCLLFAGRCWSAVAPWQEVADRIETQNLQALNRSKLVKQLIKEDRATLQKVLKDYRRRAVEAETQLKPLTGEYERLKNLEQNLRQELSLEQDEIENIQGTVFGFARQSSELFENSPLGPALNEQRATVEAIAARKRFPGMAEIESLVALFRKYRQSSADIQAYQGDFVGRDGRLSRGNIVRIGGLAAVYKQDGEQGYLVPTNNGRELSAVVGSIPGRIRAKIGAFIEGRDTDLPLDISGGAAFVKLTHQKTLLDTIKAGGFLVWPILGVGLLAVLLAAEKLLFFLRIRSNSDRIINTIVPMVAGGEIDSCLNYCRSNERFPLCKVLRSGLQHIGQSQEVLENVLHEALLQQIPRFERFLPTLAMLAGIAPLLGLLGTVTGMISTFQVINLFGTGDPRMMSGGISEALITTQLGLVVAIPILFVHHLFERKVDVVLTDMEEKGTAFMIATLKKSHHRSPEVAHEPQPLPASH